MAAVELNLESEPGEPLARLLTSWFEGALHELAAAARARLAEQGKLPADSVRRSGIPCGPPDGLWGFVTIVRNGRRSPRVFSEKNVSWFLEQLRDPPQDAELGIMVLNADGMPDARTPDLLRVGFGYGGFEAPGWLRLRLRTEPDWRHATDAMARAHETAMVGFLRSRADLLNPSYGSIGDEAPGIGDTSLEACLPVVISPAEQLPAGRARLRGYSWVTVLAAELIDKVGGVSALQRSGEFAEVVPLAHGGLWLQATEHLADYDDDAMLRVWQALKPVIPPGMPRDPYPHGGGPQWKVVFRDASDPD
jgi:hypothetical protein